MSARGTMSVAAVECLKIASQLKARLLLAACVAGPVVSAAVIHVQSAVPADTLFGRAARDSGFALALLILGFAGLWVLPVLASVVAGDVFAADDRYGTWKTILTRSRNRADVFGGKVLAAAAFALVAIAALAASSVSAGVLLIGSQPLIDVSGVLRPWPEAFSRVALAWLSIVPPTLALTSVAVLLSIVTRSSAAGIGLPVLAALTMQLATLVDGPETLRRLLITSAFAAWHGLLAEPQYYRPLVDAAIVSAAYVVVCLSVGYGVMRKRDIGG